MTNVPKSKKTKVWTLFFACVPLMSGAFQSAQAQNINDGRPFGELAIRGSINQELVDDNGVGTEQAAQEPIELGQQASNTPVRPVQRASVVGTLTDDLVTETRSNSAVDPVQTSTAVQEDSEPFDATGMRIGNTEVQMSLEQSIGYSSNVSQASGGEGGAFSQTDANLNFTSDWSRNEWQSTISGSYRRPFDSEASEDISLSADSQLRLDLIDGMSLTTRGFYSLSTQEFTSTILAPGAVDTPLAQSFGGSVELERTDRKLQFAIRGLVQRDIFADADLGGGLVQSQEDQNNNLYSLGLRVGYETSPVLTPFLEGIYSIRDFDSEVDRNGNRRDSDIFEIRAGLEVDLGEKVQGEVAVGYVTEQFDDPMLDDLTGFTLNGSMNWSPERDSQIALTLGTRTNNSIAANENGSLIYNARVDYDRRINDRLSFDAFAGLEVETNDNSNTTFEIGTGVQYWVNRFVAVTADVEYSSFTSDAVNSDFDEVSARVGVRLQR